MSAQEVTAVGRASAHASASPQPFAAAIPQTLASVSSQAFASETATTTIPSAMSSAASTLSAMSATASTSPAVSTPVDAPRLDEVHNAAVEIEALLVARLYIYELLHKVLGAAPDASLLDALFGDTTARVIDEYAVDSQTMAGLGSFLAQLTVREDREVLLSDVRDEYTRLFWAPGVLPVPMWEAPYRTHEATLFQENTLMVRAWYQRFGLAPKRMQRVPDDHVALMCHFMALQSRSVLDALRAGELERLTQHLRDQATFVSEHMRSWLPECAKRMRATKTAVLYPQVFEAAAAFVELDATFLVEALYWLDTDAHSVTPADGVMWCAASDSAEARVFAEVDQAYQVLTQIRPFGIEDNELETRTDDDHDL